MFTSMENQEKPFVEKAATLIHLHGIETVILTGSTRRPRDQVTHQQVPV